MCPRFSEYYIRVVQENPLQYIDQRRPRIDEEFSKDTHEERIIAGLYPWTSSQHIPQPFLEFQICSISKNEPVILIDAHWIRKGEKEAMYQAYTAQRPSSRRSHIQRSLHAWLITTCIIPKFINHQIKFNLFLWTRGNSDLSISNESP